MSPRLEIPPAVDLVKVNGGGKWHHLASESRGRRDGEDYATVTTVCGTTTSRVVARENGVDARAEQHQGAGICAHCKAGGSTLRPTTSEGEDTMAAAAPEKKQAKRATVSARPADRRASTENGSAPVTAAALKAAVAKAEKAIASQPARTEVDLTPAKAEKAFKLGKSIAADRYLLKRAEAGKTSADTVAAMLERIEKRVAERNAIRKGK